MIPKRVTVENFLSFRAETEIRFSDDEPLWVLGGPNGIGKSAVFDAMTYCLFAQHRCGTQDADALIHHGEDRFRVSFEFEFNAADYRIVRNKKRRAASPTQSVERRIDGQWHRIEGVDGVRPTNQWVVDTLGLNFASFQASILLRQGEAEKILDAGGAERMAILKSVLGLERFESLSARIAEDTRAKKRELKRLQDERAVAVEVTSLEVAAAIEATGRAEGAKAAADAAREVAHTGLNQAKLWEESEPKRIELQVQIDGATARSADAPRIRREFEAHRDFSANLPILRQLVPLRSGLIDAEMERTRLQTGRDTATAELGRLESESARAATRKAVLVAECADQTRRAKDGWTEHARQSNFLSAAEEATVLASKVAGFSADLAVYVATAVAAETAAKETCAQARVDRAGLDRDLLRAVELRAKFADLTIGVDCSACGQTVTAAHAEKERRTSEANAESLRRAAAESERTLRTAQSQADLADRRRTQLEMELRERDDCTRQLDAKRRDLESFGGTSDAGLLKFQIAELGVLAAAAASAAESARLELGALESTLARLERERVAAAAAAGRSVAAFAEVEKRLDAGRVRCSTLLEGLPAPHRDTPAGALAAMELEFERLADAQIAVEFEKLQHDEIRLDGWRTRLAELASRLGAIPGEARRPLRGAERDYDAAQQAALAADAAWQTARQIPLDLQRRAETFAALVAKILAAEMAANISIKLHDLLGNAGLLRELVRIAEVDIVGHADRTLRKLSDGELSLELSREPRNDGEALVLMVRSADSTQPTPVGFLSGSEKFRVALAIALGIGQFASGQTRPLECVIIDEGFGSLDPKGLRTAAEELNRLKKHLKRIIIVSHQEEFTDHFPVVIQLQKTDEGVTATTVRR